MVESIDILSSTPRRLKKEIENILSSYSNQWDILSELLQNSVDSIRRWNNENPSTQKQHHICIDIDSSKNVISIEDSGTGFDPDVIPDLLAPHGTDKEQSPDEVGEKGVGLTYTMFSCNLFRLQTTSVKGSASATYEGGMSWLKIQSKDQQPLLSIDVEKSQHNPLDTYSKITLEDVDNLNDDLELFDWNVNQIVHILRTKTAVGNFKKLINEEPLDIDVTLRTTTKTGDYDERKVNFLYQDPTEFVEKEFVFDINKRATELVGLKDGELKEKLNGHTLRFERCFESSSRKLYYIAYYVPGGEKFWKKVSRDTFDADPDDENSFRHVTKPGIYAFVKGMPTGIVIDSPSTGSGGYWNGLFVLINADYLQFDMGRKSIGNRTKGLFQDAAKDAFKQLGKYLPYVSKEEDKPPKIPHGFGKKKKNILERLNKLPNLDITGVSYLKYPDSQEAAVAAIFHEMVGAGIIKGYCGLGWSYAAQYDMVARYKGPIEELVGKNLVKAALEDNGGDSDLDEDLIIEFKYKAESVLKDIHDSTKQLQDINIIVCWEVNESRFAEEGVTVKPIKRDDAYFHSTNYSISFPVLFGLGETNSCKYIIALKDLVTEIKRGNNQIED